MRFWLHVRDYEHVRSQLAARGLWLADPAEDRGELLRWTPVPPTRPLTDAERRTDAVMREIPVAADAAR